MKASGEGGAPGQWTANKSMRMSKAYEAKGGDYEETEDSKLKAKKGDPGRHTLQQAERLCSCTRAWPWALIICSWTVCALVLHAPQCGTGCPRPTLAADMESTCLRCPADKHRWAGRVHALQWHTETKDGKPSGPIAEKKAEKKEKEEKEVKETKKPAAKGKVCSASDLARPLFDCFARAGPAVPGVYAGFLAGASGSCRPAGLPVNTNSSPVRCCHQCLMPAGR